MKTLMNLMLCATLAVACTAITGCKTGESDDTEVSLGSMPLCKGCGQMKSTDACCAADAVKCGGCELAKGSPGCCRIDPNSDEPAALCTGCGQFKGSDACCVENAAKCSECGLAKGSPGCCKM